MRQKTSRQARAEKARNDEPLRELLGVAFRLDGEPDLLQALEL
jgi:hypothetical protein